MRATSPRIILGDQMDASSDRFCLARPSAMPCISVARRASTQNGTRGHSRLLNLPVEIVLHIIYFLHEDRDDIPLYFQPIWALSLVNCAFYITATPARYYRVVLPTISKLRRFVDFIGCSRHTLDPGQRPYEDLIRHLRVGSFRRMGNLTDDLHVHWKWDIPMNQLQSFQCFIASDAERLCRIVQLFPRLTTLTTMWPHAADLCLLLSHTPARRMRVFLFAPDSLPEASMPHPHVTVAPAIRGVGQYPLITLTHLSIAARGLFSAYLHELCSLTLPDLHAFHLDQTPLNPLIVFKFIARHEKLAAVTVYFHDRFVLLSAIVELMHGEFGLIERDNRRAVDIEPAGDNNRSVNNVYDPYPASESIACIGFSFERKFHGHSDLYEMYTVTALGLAVANSDDAWPGLSLGYPGMRELFTALSEEKRLQQTVQELSILANCDSECVRVSTVWRFFAREMRNWRRLSQVRLWWPLEESSFSWALLRQGDTFSVLQNTGPPLTREGDHLLRAWGYPMTLNAARIEDRTCLSPTIRILDRLGLDVDYSDPGLLMEAWRRLRERELQFAMREVTENIPTLEQITWFPQYQLVQPTIVTWEWTLHESHIPETGSVEYMTNRLRWTTAHGEMPCPPCIAVGREYQDILHLRRCL
ncbi:hypothetical protein K474DRAFT_1714076 [Panus rudis PR-1116 ss-1]|nr:hypothetical protein K474DRAFT_1714076 [Panus rudis PR-1116 ss-1]